jgi:hypothetical protein
MIGTRVEWTSQILNPGEYAKLPDGTWYACAPDTYSDDALDRFVANLSGHSVVEHEDGTITVWPSILIKHHDGKQWHGYIERGRWRSV